MTIGPGTGVFIPAYGVAKHSKRNGTRKGPQNFKNDGTAQSSGCSNPSHNSDSSGLTAVAPQSVHPINGAAAGAANGNGINRAGPWLSQPQALHQPPSPSPSSFTAAVNDTDVLTAATRDTSFTSNCSSLLGTSPFAPYAATSGSAALSQHPPAFTDTAYTNLQGSSALVAPQQQLLLPQPTSHSVLSTDDMAEMASLLQQELELEAAINDLMALKQQLATQQRQPSIIPQQQQLLLPAMHPAASLTVSAATAAMVPNARRVSSASAPWEGALAVPAVHVAVTQVQQQQQQLVVVADQHLLQERLQSEMLQLLSLV